MLLQLINDVNTLKSTDNATEIVFAVVDEQKQFVDLSQYTNISVNIGSAGSLVSTEIPTVDLKTNTFAFTLSNSLPEGTYQIQVNLTTEENKLHIVPNRGSQLLKIEKSFNEVNGQTIAVMTVKQLLDDMAETLKLAEESNTKSDMALETANGALTKVEGTLEAAESSLESANNAVEEANKTLAQATTAIEIANNAKSTADEAKTDSVAAVESANAAVESATTALENSNVAKQDAEDAKSIAQGVKDEFAHLTEGNTDAELIAARTDEEGTTHETLKARIDSEATKRSKAVNDALQDAKNYTDSKVGDIDFSKLATKEETTSALQNAKDYTDGKVGNIDFSTLATKQENEANLQTAKDYTDNKVSGIDLTSYATKDEINAMIGDTSTLVTNDKTIVGAINEVASNSGGSSAKVYGIKIDTTNSNPETALTYIDDATDFTPARMNFTTDTFEYGSWANKFPFNQIKPCLFKDGAVVGYLNPNDYSKFVDGTSADITSGNSGDVMIEFPIVYWKFNTLGNYLYIRYSDTKIDDGYKCLAHMRGTEVRDKCYVSAYLGYELNGKLRSLSGKTPTGSKTIGAFRTLAQANGSGYDQMAYYQLLMLQVLYIVMFKDRDSQTALGSGYVDGNYATTTTGNLNTKGLFYGETTDKAQMKFCGVEDFYGNIRYWIDGYFYDSSRNMLIGNQSFNNTGSGYTNYGQAPTASLSGYINSVQGGTETGFIPKATSGSATTYYPDYGYLNPSRLPHFGGDFNATSYAGAFCLSSDTASYSSAGVGARLLAL